MTKWVRKDGKLVPAPEDDEHEETSTPMSIVPVRFCVSSVAGGGPADGWTIEASLLHRPLEGDGLTFKTDDEVRFAVITRCLIDLDGDGTLIVFADEVGETPQAETPSD